MKDMVLEHDYIKGSKGKKVRLIQEWLSLNGIGVVPDGDFGAATDLAVREFQDAQGLDVDGVVGEDTFKALVAPMARALQEMPAENSLGAMIVAYAMQHLRNSPREIGGQNMGPWVRLYMKGNEGQQWPWCAGFVSFVLEQACATMGSHLPVKSTFSCDLLATDAKEKGILWEERRLDRSRLRPGMLFLQRRSAKDWEHVGIVVKADAEVFLTIEGNTNDEGSREGYEVCRRVRGYRSKDFVAV